jgi:hypothetical protein
MELRYVLPRIEEKKDYKKSFIKLATSIIKALVLSGLYYGVYQIKIHSEDIKELCLLYGDKAKKEKDQKLLLIFYSISTCGALLSCIYLTSNIFLKQKQIGKFQEILKPDLEAIIISIKQRVSILHTLDQFYSGRINKDEISQTYKTLSEDNKEIGNDLLEKIIRTDTQETLEQKIKELAYQFLKLENKNLEIELLKKHRSSILHPYKFNSYGIGLIISICGVALSSAWTAGFGYIVEQSKIVQVASDIAKLLKNEKSTDNDYTFKEDSAKVLSDLRFEYDKLFGFSGIAFNEVYQDELNAHIRIDTKYELDGTKSKHNCQDILHEEYYEKGISTGEFIMDSFRACVSCFGEVFSCTKSSGYEAISWSSSQVATGAGHISKRARTCYEAVRNLLSKISSELTKPLIQEVELEEVERESV